MTALASSEQRIDELLALRKRIDAEIARVRRAASKAPLSRRSRYVTPACGTESGYQRHRVRGEKCDACRVAHAAHNRRKQRLARWESEQ